jgi:cytochrome c oxidase assembly protein subunit 15
LLIVLQAALGISTLLLRVPLPLALGHQALAFMLAGATVAWLADIAPRRPRA